MTTYFEYSDKCFAVADNKQDSLLIGMTKIGGLYNRYLKAKPEKNFSGGAGWVFSKKNESKLKEFFKTYGEESKIDEIVIPMESVQISPVTPQPTVSSYVSIKSTEDRLRDLEGQVVWLTSMLMKHGIIPTIATSQNAISRIIAKPQSVSPVMSEETIIEDDNNDTPLPRLLRKNK